MTFMHVKNNSIQKQKKKHVMIYRIAIIFYLIIKKSLPLYFPFLW